MQTEGGSGSGMIGAGGGEGGSACSAIKRRGKDNVPVLFLSLVDDELYRGVPLPLGAELRALVRP